MNVSRGWRALIAASLVTFLLGALIGWPFLLGAIIGWQFTPGDDPEPPGVEAQPLVTPAPSPAPPTPSPTPTATPTPTPNPTPAPLFGSEERSSDAQVSPNGGFVPATPLVEPVSPLTGEGVRTIGREVGFPAVELDNLACIVDHESRNDRHAVNHNTNGSTDYGLAQLNSWWATSGPNAGFGPRLDLTRVFDAFYNLSFAFRIWRDGGIGWKAWSTAGLCGLA